MSDMTKNYSLEVRLLAEWMHYQYLDITDWTGWEVQKQTKVKFEELPEANKLTMMSLAERLLKLIKAED